MEKISRKKLREKERIDDDASRALELIEEKEAEERRLEKEKKQEEERLKEEEYKNRPKAKLVQEAPAPAPIVAPVPAAAPAMPFPLPPRAPILESLDTESVQPQIPPPLMGLRPPKLESAEPAEEPVAAPQLPPGLPPGLRPIVSEKPMVERPKVEVKMVSLVEKKEVEAPISKPEIFKQPETAPLVAPAGP